MSNDESQWETLQESILERLSISLQGISLGSNTSPEVLGSDASPEVPGSYSATTSECSGSAATNDLTRNNRFNFVLEYFYCTFCDSFDSIPVFKRVGNDIGHFVRACRFVLSHAQPLFPNVPDLPDLMDEVSELRNLGLELHLNVERAKGLKTRCFMFMDTIHQAYLDSVLSSDDTTIIAKNLLDEATTIISLINVIIRDNRRRIQYFYTHRGQILSHFSQN